MYLKVIFFSLIICSACQSGKIPCPEVKFVRIKESNPHKRSGFFAPAPTNKMLASTKELNSRQAGSKNNVDLDRLRATRTTGKEMLEHYGTVEEWDCPSPSGKKKHSKVAKENIRKNERKMRDHLKNKTESDSLRTVSPIMFNK